MHVEVVAGNLQVAFNARTFELEMVPFPLVIELELAGEILGKGFCRFAGMFLIKSVGAMYIDYGHESVFSSKLKGFTV